MQKKCVRVIQEIKEGKGKKKRKKKMEKRKKRKTEENKFVYTTEQSCDWAGAVMPENHEKSEVISDRPTDMVNYRVACTRLKIHELWIGNFTL